MKIISYIFFSFLVGAMLASWLMFWPVFLLQVKAANAFSGNKVGAWELWNFVRREGVTF